MTENEKELDRRAGIIIRQEKRIEELENTNKKISDECHKLVDSLGQKQKRIAELEEKIANLKEQVQSQVEATIELDKENAELKERYNKVDIIGYDALKSLTKAKEIIKTLADDLSIYSGNYQKELLEARQFLKEIEE